MFELTSHWTHHLSFGALMNWVAGSESLGRSIGEHRFGVSEGFGMLIWGMVFRKKILHSSSMFDEKKWINYKRRDLRVSCTSRAQRLNSIKQIGRLSKKESAPQTPADFSITRMTLQKLPQTAAVEVLTLKEPCRGLVWEKAYRRMSKSGWLNSKAGAST